MNKEIKTDNFIISENSPAYIIAEIGINHNGQYELAKQLIIESAKAGANAVKFQKRDANSIMIKENINPNPIGYLSKKVDDISTDQPDYGSNLKKVADHLGISINPNHRVFIDVVEDDDYYINFQAAPREVALAVTRAVMVTYFIGTTEVLETLNDINGTNWKTIEEALAVDGMLGIKIPFYPSKSVVKLYSKPFREKIGGNLEFDAATYSVLEQIYSDKFHSHRRLINEGLVLGKEPRTGRTVIYCARNGARSPR